MKTGETHEETATRRRGKAGTPTLKYWRAMLDGRLTGRVFGDDRRPDGTPITTSAVIECDGRTAVTKSGTVYILGEKT